MAQYTPIATLNTALDHIKQAPSDTGTIDLIVCRPTEGQRAELKTAELNGEEGLVGDNWLSRGSKRKGKQGPANPDMQINIMSSRAIATIVNDKQRWALAGDQFIVDFDLSKTNLPPGTKLLIGNATIEITAEPHLGCRKFAERFGKDAVMFVNSEAGKELNLRGVNAKVIAPGTVNIGDSIQKL